MQAAAGRIAFSGALELRALGALWNAALAAARAHPDQPLTIDIADCRSVDTAGATLLLTMERAHGGAVALTGAVPQAAALLDRMRKAVPETAPAREPVKGAPGLFSGVVTRLTFFGEAVLALIALPAKLRFLRGAAFAEITDNAGLRALPLVLMLGVLIGLILAFQSAIPMRQFGADLYVANLVSIALFRELGPLLVAVILAGRTGSAFAAELGTMKVNEEVAALTTMGIDPATMLVLPRIGAAVAVMPALVVALDVAGLIGMAIVLMVLGFPPSAIIKQVTSTSHPSDFILGLAKGLFFAAAVALIGCRAGLTAGDGPRAVGQAATAAVVGGIVATVVLDGVFAVMTYQLEL